MASARIHEAIALEINKKYHMDELLLRLGTISPDCWRNVQSESESGEKSKYQTHFWDFRIKKGQANVYIEFYLKYYSNLTNPFYFGYLVHLIVDQYWKTYIDPLYEETVAGEKILKLKNGKYHDDKNYFSYYESLKIQKQLSKIYCLGPMPTKQEEIPNFECNIDELNLNGLFGNNGSVKYINSVASYEPGDEESILYDNESILRHIKETVSFVEIELQRLKEIKRTYDSKIKIAIDIDDTLLCTKELEEYYWKIFLSEHTEINPNREYKWGDPELALFWKEHRENMAFGKLKEYASISLKEMLSKGYILDLVSARPLEKYTSLKKKLVEYFENIGLEYSHINLGFYSKIDFLKEHDYDILIDNELRHIKAANEAGINTILYGLYNEEYNGIQTSNWIEIPILVEKIINEKKHIL